ncbi:MAG: AMP-binding protein [Planctomycetota bacterium]|nr:AMP-binding protein [Planctomycetota bacterium]
MAAELIRDFIASVDRDPDRVAVHDLTSGRKTSRGEILAAAAQAARRLDATVPEDGVVMLHGPSGAGYWAGLLAILGSGRRMLPIGIETTARDRATLHDAHRVDAVIETDASVGWAESPATVHLQVMDGIGIPRGNDAGVLARGSSGSLLLRSSGTTGRPAVALRTGAALDRVSETLLRVIELVDDDEVLATLPMQHAYGIEHGVLAPMRAGASVRFRPGFDLAGGVEALANGVTVFPGVPVTLEAAAREGRLDSRLRLAYSAGSSLPEVVREAFAEAWGCPTGNLYGATELGTITYGIGGLDAAVAGVSIRVAAVVDEDRGDRRGFGRTRGAKRCDVRRLSGGSRCRGRSRATARRALPYRRSRTGACGGAGRDHRKGQDTVRCRRFEGESHRGRRGTRGASGDPRSGGHPATADRDGDQGSCGRGGGLLGRSGTRVFDSP